MDYNVNLNITEAEFNKIKDIVYKKVGVFLKPSKKQLVVSRLRSRLEKLKLNSFSDYIKILDDSNSPEFEIFVNAITTNETYFFRHIKQFDFIRDSILPDFIKNSSNGPKEIIFWSAACSTGEEPYTLSIVCKEFFNKHPGFSYKIIATDINSDVINLAKQGIYTNKSLREMPPALISKYFTKIGANKLNSIDYKISQEIVKKVEFKKHNLLNQFFLKNIDVVFLRNVMIYFDSDTKQKVVSNIFNNICPKGYFVISLSESLIDVKVNYSFVQSGIYRKQ